MTDVFDTISSEDREKVEKLADIVRKSPFYKQWANYYGSVAEPYPVDTKPRTATVSFLLCGDAFRKDNSLKKAVVKEIEQLVKDIELVMNPITVVWNRSYNQLNFTLKGLHTPKEVYVSDQVPCGALYQPMFAKVVRLASVLLEIFRLGNNLPLVITFIRKDGSGERKTLATDIRVPRKTAPNYPSFVMREAARLMSDAADPNDPCDGFSPDRVEIVAIDTGDTYKFNL